MNNEIISELYVNNIIKYGDFTLKSGKKSDTYIDFRNVIGVPSLMKNMC